MESAHPTSINNKEDLQMDYETMSIDEIIEWCQENGQVAWLKKEAAKKVDCKVYPRMTVINEKGRKVSKADKSQEPKIEKRPITFIQLKINFVDKFMPEIRPTASEAEPTMYDRIKAL